MLGQRLAQLRKRCGWTQARLAAVIGENYERSMISHVESGRATLHLNALIKVARALDVSIDYLAGLTEDPSPADDRSRSSSSELRRVPLRAATDPSAMTSDIESAAVIGHLAFRSEWLLAHGISADSCSVIEVPDDSMDPTLQVGAWILVDHGRTRRRGNGVFALHVGNALRIGRAVYSDDDWLLAADNPKVQARAWPREAKIFGQVVWTGKVL
ncbi:MAG: helix-turn-helix domain-containing protein [Bryobacterales bacterium]|nr:helix-turn-helix domain-containing protein [Bryobacterales bacterium]